MKAAWPLLACALGGCSGGNVATTGSPFDPVKFFTGRTHGDATLRLIGGSHRRVSIDSFGAPDRHGGLKLDQVIREQGKPPRERSWLLRPAGSNRWTGTLSDAQGPVDVERTSSEVTINYRMRNGARVEQHLQQPPTGVVENHMIVSRFGIRLATLDEHIRKAGA